MNYRSIKPLHRPPAGVVTLPGSKSITNRALVVAALGNGVSRLVGGLQANDTVVMRDGLRALGINLDDVDDPWLVEGTGGTLRPGLVTINGGASGTTVRFLTAVAALASGPITIDGTERMRRRPIGELADALTVLGCRVGFAGETGFLPLSVRGGGLQGGPVTIDASRSSQFASALLMIGPLLPEGLTLELAGIVVSRPYLTSTIEVMRAFGGRVDETEQVLAVSTGGYRKTSFEIEADASAAAYPLLAAAITGGTVRIDGISEGSTQPDWKILDVLVEMGCLLSRGAGHITLTGPEPGDMTPVTVDLAGAPDAAVAVAVGAMFARGTSRLSGLSTLRLKESDRLTAVATEIGRMGGRALIAEDMLVIEGGHLHGARVETYDDHRIAMAFAVAGLAIDGVEITNPDCVNKTWPGFWDMLESLS